MAFGVWADGVWTEAVWASGVWEAASGPSAPTVSIDGSPEVNIPVDGTLQLTTTTTGEPAPSVSWGSSNELVATVDANGLVTGVAEGTAVITATATNASGSDDDTVTVNVVVSTPSAGGMGAHVGITIGI